MSLLIKVKNGVPWAMDEGDNPSFEEWEKRVDRFIQKAVGVGLDDLEDCPTRRWYEERLRPIRAANRALKRAGADLFRE
jgi:hypothetical protein